MSSLHAAAQRGNLTALKQELDFTYPSPPVDLRDANHCTPLFLACAGGKVDVVRFLHSRGADVNSVNGPRGWTPVWVASCQNHVELVQVLCQDMSASVECPDKRGRTPLWVGASKGFMGVLKALHGHGGDICMADNEHCSPLLAACSQSHNPTTNNHNNHNNHIIDNNNQIDIVTLLLTHGADGKHINTPNTDGLTPQWVAAYHGNVPLIRLLHSHGADINLPNYVGETPIWIACLRNQFRAVTALYELGGDVDTASLGGGTPLWMAAERGNFDMVRALHVLGCDLDKCHQVAIHTTTG